MNPDLVFGALQKPLKGEYVLERKRAERQHKEREREVMAAVKAEDGHRCRVPGCRYSLLRVEVAHEKHRGMGGNPTEDRTVPEVLIALCLRHHQAYDKGDLEIEPRTERGLRGPCAYTDHSSGLPVSLGVETRYHYSVTRSVR